MQGTYIRCLALIAVLAPAVWLQAAFGDSAPSGPARWPTTDEVYAVGNWEPGPLVVDTAHGTSFVSREYRQSSGLRATLALATATNAKWIYRAGADAPFLGSGYAVGPAPQDVVPARPGRGAFIARREGETWLVLHALGERRGLVGDGLHGWAMVAIDAIARHPNDYFKAHVVVPLDPSGGASAPSVHEAVALADTMFSRIATWYAG
jgi:hypothetical protein